MLLYLLLMVRKGILSVSLSIMKKPWSILQFYYPFILIIVKIYLTFELFKNYLTPRITFVKCDFAHRARIHNKFKWGDFFQNPADLLFNWFTYGMNFYSVDFLSSKKRLQLFWRYQNRISGVDIYKVICICKHYLQYVLRKAYHFD